MRRVSPFVIAAYVTVFGFPVRASGARLVLGPTRASNSSASPSNVVNPFFTVGPDPNGWNFGPLINPSSTTSGIQEAINAASAQGGGTVYISPTSKAGISHIYTFTTQITMASNVVLHSGMWGGGHSGQLNLPGSYLQFTGLAAVGTPVLFSNTDAAGLIGIAIYSTVAGLNNLVNMSGGNNCFFDKCLIATNDTTSGTIFGNTTIGYPAFQIDGYVHFCEMNHFNDCLFSGGYGCQIGTAQSGGSSQRSNDCLWTACQFEGPEIGGSFQVPAGQSALNLTDGGGHHFYNFYSRGDTHTNAGCYQIQVTGGNVNNIYVVGTEQYSPGNGGLLYMSAGTLTYKRCNFTSGKISMVAGSLFL